jgi:hypothetical protein
MTKKTGGEKTHRRLLDLYAELSLEIITIPHDELTRTYGVQPAICPAGRFVGESSLICNVIQRKAYVVLISPPAEFQIRNRIVWQRGYDPP